MHCFIPQKRSGINVDTLVFIPHVISIPSTTVDDFIRQATSDIINLRTHLPNYTAPVIQLGDTTRKIILQVTNVLNSNQVTSTVLKNKHQLTANVAARLSPSHTPP